MDPDINEYKTDIVTWLKVITVHSVKCKIGELPDQRNSQLGTCLLGEMSVLSSLAKQPISAKNTAIFRIQNRYL